VKASGKGSTTVAKDAAKNMPTMDLTTYLLKNRDQIDKVKPRNLSTERFIKIVARAVYTNPALAVCNFRSIFMAALQSAELGLEPGGVLGHAALVPYKGKAVFQIMYKGLLVLAHATGQFKMIDTCEVYENDKFKYHLDFEPTFIHIPADGERGKVIGYYAFFVLAGGGKKFIYMTREAVDAWAKRYSKAYDKTDSPWQNFFDEMAKKTVLRKVLKMAPLRVELPVDQEDIDAYGLTPHYTTPEDTIPGDYEEVEKDTDKSAQSQTSETESQGEDIQGGAAEDKQKDAQSQGIGAEQQEIW